MNPVSIRRIRARFAIVLVLASFFAVSCAQGKSEFALAGLGFEALQFEATQVLEFGEVSIVAISPTGDKLAAYSRGDSKLSLYWIKDKALQFAITVPKTIDLGHFTWSPNGKYLAFSENSPVYMVDSDIYLVDCDTGKIMDLSDDGYYGELLSAGDDLAKISLDTVPSWAGDSKSLYYQASRKKLGIWQSTLMRVSLSGGSPESLATLASNYGFIVCVGDIVVSPYSGELFFTKWPSDLQDPLCGAYRIGARGENETRITQSMLAPAGIYGLSSGNAYCLLVSAQTEYAQKDPGYSLLNTSDGSLVPLAKGEDVLSIASATVSPDGRFLAYFALPSPRGEVALNWILVAREIASGKEARFPAPSDAPFDEGCVDGRAMSSMRWALNGDILIELCQGGFVRYSFRP